MGVGDPQSAPPVGIVDAEIVFKPTTLIAIFNSASSDPPDPPPDAIPCSVDEPARPEQASNGRHYIAQQDVCDCRFEQLDHLHTVLT